MIIAYRIEQFVRDVIRDYQSEFLHQPKIEHSGYDNSLQRWIHELIAKNERKYSRYNDILSGIDIHQRGTKALFHYVGFDVIYGELNPEDYWSAYGCLYRSCRSTVVDLSTGDIIIRPFDKFFNINELRETSQDVVEQLVEHANSIEISDKLDGSIFCASCNVVRGHRKTETEVTYCTSQSLDPETSWHLKLGISLVTPQIDKMIHDNVGCTFMFEMIHPDDAHVVFYPEAEKGLHLIGIRDNVTGRLATYREVIDTATRYDVMTTRVFDKTLGQVLTELDDKSSDEAEGFVIRIDDEMFKLKYNDYVFMHKTINRLVSASTILETYRNGQIDDLIAKVPLSYREQVKELVYEIDEAVVGTRLSLKKIKAATDDIQDFVERMKWIQTNVPKIISGYAFEYVKTGQYQFFKDNRPMDMKRIRQIVNDTRAFLTKRCEKTIYVKY